MPPDFTPDSPTLLVTTAPELPPRIHPHLSRVLIGAAGVIVLAALVTTFLMSAPQGTYPRTITVTAGMSVRDIAAAAKEAGAVRSSFLLYAALTLRHDPTGIFAGDYRLAEPQGVLGLAATLASGEIESVTVAVTLPEGISVREMGAIIGSMLPQVDTARYEAAAAAREGRLFPETYYVPPTFTTEEFIALQEATYEERVGPLRPQIEASGMTEAEVITLASIVEREANDETSMRMVAGILRNRLDIGMALQADATMEYALKTPLGELAPGELATALREVDSPYNTYLYPGLPPTPIGNPGLTAIRAVIEPTPSPYLFYITGTDGNFYYAITYEDHARNIATYLR